MSWFVQSGFRFARQYTPEDISAFNFTQKFIEYGELPAGRVIFQFLIWLVLPLKLPAFPILPVTYDTFDSVILLVHRLSFPFASRA